ncbi:hypothetical protein [Pseudolysinimonas sp.]|jgi:hypothetical protein|uniref:hypothetical protein n=1 Tax=Pseudolysinimonas sp. TaxID=2680009 RepID=UPI003783DEEE
MKDNNRTTSGRVGIGRLKAALAVVALGVALPLMSASAAQATDWGGDGNPTGCSSPYTVASQTIYGSRGSLNGVAIGQLELRWSWGCYANWSRVVLYGGMGYSDPVTIRQEVYAEGRSAISEDVVTVPAGGTSAWTRYLHLANSSSTACVSGSVSSNFGTLNFHTNGTSFCA